MITTFVVLALIWPLLWVIRLIVVTRLLMGMEFQQQSVTVVAEANIPPHLREAAQGLIHELEQLGFQLLGGWRIKRTVESSLDDDVIVLTHTRLPIRALIQAYGESARSGQCWVSLCTTTADGHELLTASHRPEDIVPMPIGIDFEVIRDGAAKELLQRHVTRIASVSETAWMCSDLESSAVREQSICDGTFAQLLATGFVGDRGRGVVSFRAWPALKRSMHVMRHAAAQKKAQKARPSPPSRIKLTPESQTAFDLQHYRQTIAVMSGKLSRRSKSVITVVSFLLFAAALAWSMSPVVAVSLIVALIIHEFGHLAGMWWFGYRDTQLLFIPFLGGAAVGHDDRVLAPWKHIVIILLGPLPGIFISLALLAVQIDQGTAAWLQEAALTMLVLNAFNLLPILPLDGGQIVDYAIASRFPRARVLFLALSAACLLLTSLVFTGVKLLMGLGIVMLIRLPLEWRLAGVRRDVREEFPDGGEEEPIVRRLLAEMREPQWEKTAMATRLQTVRGLQQILRMPPAGLGTMCFALAAFSTPFWAGLPLAGWVVIKRGETAVTQAHQRAAAAGLTAEVASRPAQEIEPEENAALLYEKARALSSDEGEFSRSTDHRPEVVKLLREAAAKRIFAPVDDDAAGSEKKPFELAMRGLLLTQLTSASEEKLRYNEPEEALALALDALRLSRLMDSAPGWWDWHAHKRVTESAWRTIEEVLAAGPELTPNVLNELSSLAAEDAEIAFAAEAIPRGMLVQGRRMDDYVSHSDAGFILWAFALLQRMNPVTIAARTAMIDQAIVANDHLKAIRAGEWPEWVDGDDIGEATTVIAQLSDVLARQREARVSLLLRERGPGGETIDSLETLSSDPSLVQHPFTRETMRLEQRGAVKVLAFESATSRLFDVEYDDSDLEWRVALQASR